ncbi:MAG TPA: hypothetical protein VJ784_03045 [Pyrinomonadaceae bacterium]|nr:hypothetical protein [Pyrinomonadaceae bacterium]
MPHHCCSQGTPSLSPSICVPGQFLRKNIASSQDVICEQRVRPSQRNCTDTGDAGSDATNFCGWGVVISAGGGADARVLLTATDADACGSGVVIGLATADCCLGA